MTSKTVLDKQPVLYIIRHMNTFLWILASVLVVSFFIMLWGIITAPEGYEDDDGFHEGTPPKNDLVDQEKK